MLDIKESVTEWGKYLGYEELVLNHIQAYLNWWQFFKMRVVIAIDRVAANRPGVQRTVVSGGCHWSDVVSFDINYTITLLQNF